MSEDRLFSEIQNETSAPDMQLSVIDVKRALGPRNAWIADHQIARLPAAQRRRLSFDERKALSLRRPGNDF